MKTMTFSEAREKLRQYYKVQELLREYKLNSKDIVIIVGRNKHSKVSSFEEAGVIRKLDLLDKVKDTEEAINKLPDDYRQYINLRFGQELSIRQVGRELYLAKSTAHLMEKDVLSALISALGRMPVAG